MQKVFTAYYKTHESEEKLKQAQKAYKDELDGRMDAYKKNLDLINKLNEEISKSDVSGALKDQKTQDRDGKISETKDLEKEITDFRQAREKQIQEQLKRMRDSIVDEIMKVVNEQVKAANYDMVFDRSGFSANNVVPVLLYARDNYDFSDSVISKLMPGGLRIAFHWRKSQWTRPTRRRRVFVRQPMGERNRIEVGFQGDKGQISGRSHGGCRPVA